MADARWRPDRPIELIAGTPKGGGQDRAARALAAALAPLLPTPIQVVNVPGRGGSVGWESLAATPGENHRLAISSPTLITNALTGASRTGPRDLTAIAMLCTEYILFVVPPASALRSAGDLLLRLADSPPPVTALATARGNVNHLALARLARHAGASGSTIPVRVFDSAREAIADVLGGRAELGAVSAASAAAETAAGKLRGLAVTALGRLPAPYALVPVWEELSVPCTIGTWRGLVAAPGMEEAAVRFWEQVVTTAVAAPGWQSDLRHYQWTAFHLGAGATAEFHQSEERSLSASLRDLGLIDG